MHVCRDEGYYAPMSPVPTKKVESCSLGMSIFAQLCLLQGSRSRVGSSGVPRSTKDRVIKTYLWYLGRLDVGLRTRTPVLGDRCLIEIRTWQMRTCDRVSAAKKP